MDRPHRRRLSTTCTFDSARCVCTPTPCSRARRAQPARNSSVAWLGNGGRDGRAHATPGRAVPAPDAALRQLQQPLRRRGLHRLHDAAQIRRQQLEEPGHGAMEHHVSDRRRDDRAHAGVGVRADDGLHRLVRDGRDGHVEVVRGGAAGLQHLDGANGRGQVLVVGRAGRVVGGRVDQQVLQRPVAGAPAREVARRVRVGVDEAREHEPSRGVELAGALRRRHDRTHGGDALTLDQDVSPHQVDADEHAAAPDDPRGSHGVAPRRAPAQRVSLSAASRRRNAARANAHMFLLPVGHVRLERQRAVDRTGDGDAGVAGRVAVAIAGGAGGARLRDSPGGPEELPDGARLEPGVVLRARSDASDAVVRDAEQRAARGLGVDDAAAEKVRGGAGNGEQGGRDQPARGRLGHGDALIALSQQRGDRGGERGELRHVASLPSCAGVR